LSFSATDKIEMDDATLIAAVADGDHHALRTLFDRHAPWVAARLRRVMPANAVEDVLQETFVAVWRGSGRYSGEGAGEAWIWGIARRQAALWVRKHGRPMANLDDEDARMTADPAAIAIRNADLEMALASLGPQGDPQRELVRMIYVEDRSVAEVARMLRVPPGTVKSRLFAARKRLREALLGGRL
jgi:RNA polymerase sigma-70 factor (ECF subfamily)